MADRQWHLRQQLELLSSPTSMHYHRIEKYSSIVDNIRRVRRVLGGDHPPGLIILKHTRFRVEVFFHRK